MKNEDHRELGKKLDLFHIQECSPGSIFWHPKGLILFREVENFVRKICEINEYQEIKTPLILDRKLWEKSGHWSKFKENMFEVHDEEREFAIKPMNCPGHIQVFKDDVRSYKELPLRYLEFGLCHRNEASGALHGLMRLRSFTQDDGHIFCEEDQIEDETANFCEQLKAVYHQFGFTNIKIKFSDRPDVRAGTDEDWDKAEKALREAANIANLDYEINKGEGAFYGPKLEFVLTDTYNREWQCGTLQVDFILAKRLKAKYVAEDGTKQHPVILHRAMLGSLERFIAILLEEYSGKLPLWLSPVQVNVLTISEKFDVYGDAVKRNLRGLGYRANIDVRPEKISRKIKDSIEQKIPVMIIIGQKEQDNDEVTIRIGKNSETISKNHLAQYMEKILKGLR